MTRGYERRGALARRVSRWPSVHRLCRYNKPSFCERGSPCCADRVVASKANCAGLRKSTGVTVHRLTAAPQTEITDS